MFETERLIIRPIEDQDFVPLKRAICLDRMDFSGPSGNWPLLPILNEEVKDLLIRKPGQLPHYAISKKPSTHEGSIEELPKDDTVPPMIGIVGLKAQGFDFKNRVGKLTLGFFDPRLRGMGYGTEVLGWLFEYAFDQLNLHKIEVLCFSDNVAGVALYRKVGCVEEGRLRKTKFRSGQWYDSLLFGMLEEEWYAMRGSKSSGYFTQLDGVAKRVSA